MTSIKHLFKGNPMFAEVQRERKRALAEHNWKGGQLAARILIGVFYFFFIVLTMNFIESIEPFVVMYVMLGLATIVIPAGLHGTIAGEREQRALDMLLVAPVTPGQIIVGKYAKSFLTLAALAFFIGAPAFFIEIVKSTDYQRSYSQSNSGMVGFLVTMILVISTAMMIGALTIWISSKTKTKTGAMLATIGALFVYFIVFPLIGGSINVVAPGLSEMIVYSNPYTLLYHAYTGIPQDYGYGYSYSAQYQALHPAVYVWPMVFAQLLMVPLFLVLATNNLKNLSLGRSE